MSELQKELSRLRENCKRIDSYFDNDYEALNYCKNKISSLNEEIKVFDTKASKFGDIITNYDNYKSCFVNYISEKYTEFYVFVFFELLVFMICLMLIISIPDTNVKIFFVFMMSIPIIYDIYIYSKVCKIKKEIADNINYKYGLDIVKLTEEDIGDMELSLLQNKVRSVNLKKEIDEYEYYFDWKREKMANKKSKSSKNNEVEIS